jgi:N-acetylmuramoyl-L-alanine amidase
MQTTLMSQPENARKKSDYEKAIREFKSVHFHDPTYSKSPLALAAVGELYADMGRRYKSDEYYGAAIQAFRYLIAQYPQSSMARDAQFTIAEIYRSDLAKPEEARKAFQEYVEKYPRFAKAGEARAKLREVESQIAQAKAPSPAAAPERPRATGLPEVTGIRRWVGPNYTRIVVNVEREVKFESSRVPNPDRIVLDLQDARLSSSLVGKTFPVENGFLHQVRIGQFRPTVTRVVLDVEKIEEYSVFTLPNPFRLVIDINGPPVEVAKAEAAASAEPTDPNAKPAPTSEVPLATEAIKPSGPAVEKKAPHDSAGIKPPTGPPAGEKAKVDAKSVEGAGSKELAAAKIPPLPSATSAKAGGAPASKADAAKPAKAPSPTQSGSRTLTRALGLKIARIVIDPGHGGHDTGTIGPTGLTEKELVLDVSLRLKKLLEEKTGAEVIMTRSDDTFIPLEERTAIANEKGADLFISIHANASRDRRARGIETYYLNFTSDPEALEVAGRENATSQESVHQLQDIIKKIALTEKIEESQDFATQVQREVYTRLRKLTSEQKNRGVKKAPFVVLIGANMPSILAEISFLTNPNDERLLKRDAHREEIAQALHRGISRYANNLGGVKITEQATIAPATTTEGQGPSSGASNF